MAKSTGNIVLTPNSRKAFLHGMGVMTRALRGTLGPKARKVAISQIGDRDKPPELLDDGATITKRIVQLPHWYEDMGAMLIRQLATQVAEQVGDGTTTAAILTHAIATQANKYVVAGGNSQLIRVGLTKGLEVALAELDKQKIVLSEPEEIGRLAGAATGDPYISQLISEIFDVIGLEGHVMVEDSQGSTVDREYVEGMQWGKGFYSPYFADEGREDSTLEDARVLVTDDSLRYEEDMFPIVEKLVNSGEKNLFIIAADVWGGALNLLVVNRQRSVFRPLAVGNPGYGERQKKICEDVAALTGARFISIDRGDKPRNATLEDLGRVRKAWANRDWWSLVGGHGDPTALRRHINQVKKEIPSIKDDNDRAWARERLGKLVGGVALLKIGAPTESERKEKKRRAEHAVAVTRVAIEEGVIVGGGMAYLNAIPALEAMKLRGDEGYGVKVLIRALQEPFRRIVENAGLPPTALLTEARRAPAGHGYDVMQEKIVDMREAGILDPVKVAKAALAGAVSSAAMAITTDVLVHRPRETAEPTPSPDQQQQ